MSIEDIIVRNVDALHENTAALNRLSSLLAGTNFTSAPSRGPVTPSPELDKAVDEAIENASSDAPKVRKPRSPNKAKASDEPTAPPPATKAPAVRDDKLYASLCELILDYAERTDEATAQKILLTFGANRAPELKPDQLERAHAAFAYALEQIDVPAEGGSSLV